MLVRLPPRSLLLVVTVPGPAVGLRDKCRRREGRWRNASSSRSREEQDVLGVRMRTDDACRDALRDGVIPCLPPRWRGRGILSICRARPATGYHEADNGIPRAKIQDRTEVGLGPEDPPVLVSTEAELRKAWADPLQTSIQLTADIFMRSCKSGGPIRESPRPLMLDGNGFTIRQTCFEKRILRQDATGFLLIKNITMTRGGNDGPVPRSPRAARSS